MNYSNLILIKHPRNWGLDEKTVENSAQKILIKHGFKSGVELSLMFVGRKKAKDLNIQYRKMDYVPQVLAFPMDEKTLGDVVICTPKLKNEAKFLGREIMEILSDWLDHGVANLER